MGRADDGHHLWTLRIGDRDDHHAGVAADPGMGAGDRDAPGSGKDPARIERDLPLQEIVERVAIEQRAGPHHDEPFLEVRHVEVAVHRVHGALEVVGVVRPRRVGGRGGGRCHAGRIGGLHVKLLAQGGYRRRGDPLGEGLVIDEGDVEHPQAVGAAGGVEVFPTRLHLQHLALLEGIERERHGVGGGMVMRFLQHAVVRDMLAEVIRKCDALEGTADHRLRLLLLGHDHARKPACSEAYPTVSADEIRVVGALHEQLRHDRVVVIVLRHVAVAAHLRFVRAGAVGGEIPLHGGMRAAADGVGHVRAERDAAVALGRDRLLLHVDRLAVGVVGADVDRAARSRGADPVAGGVAIAGQHEDIVAQRLEVVGDVVARHVPLIMQPRRLLVDLLRQMAAKAAGVPGAVAGDTAHQVVAMGARFWPGGPTPLERPVLGPTHRLGKGRQRVVMLAFRVDGGLRLLDLPSEILLHHRVLVDAFALDDEPPLARGRAEGPQVAASLGARGVARGAAGPQRREAVGRSVAVDAGDFDRRANLAVELGVAVHVLDEVAVDAVHPALHVDVEHVHGHAVPLVRYDRLFDPDLCRRLLVGVAVDLLDPLRHLHGRPLGRVAPVGDDVSLVIEQISLAVVLQDRSVGPAMAVEVGELGVLGAVVEVGEISEKLGVREQVFRGRLVGVGELAVDHLLGARIPLLLRIDQVAVGLLVPPHVADVAVHDVGAGMDVTDDALAGWNPVARSELVVNRVPALPFGDRGIGGETKAAVAERRIGPRMDRRAVVGVDHMAAGAAAGAIVARLVVGAEEVQRGIEEPRLVQAHEDWIRAVFGAQPAGAQSRSRSAILFESFGIADFGSEPSAALEEPQHVARLLPLEPRQWVEILHHRLVIDLVLRRRRNRLQALGDALVAVALPVRGPLVGDRTIVVERGIPEHATVRHHALLDLQHDRGVAPAATLLCGP